MSTAVANTGRLPGRGLITISVMLATIMQAIDTTIANVALPHMQGSLSATQDQIAWVLTSYIVAAAIMTPPTGYLASRFGRKQVFVVAVTGFVIASMLCGAAVDLNQLVLFRLLQGVFGASLVPLSQAVLLDTYPPEQHGSAMAIWGVGVMLGPILGPTLGGYLTEYYNWRWVFFINLPVGILALLGILRSLPETERDSKRAFDVFGFALLSLAIGALQMMLDRGETLDWFSSTEIVTEMVLAGLCFYLFMVHILTAEQPFISPGLFKDRNFATGLIFIFIVGIILLASLALMPPFLQGLLGYPVITTGLVLGTRGLGTMVAMFIVGKLIGKIDIRRLIATGLSLVSFSLWQMTQFTTDVATWTIVWSGIIQGMGLGFLFVPLSTVSFATLEPRLRNEAAALFSLLRNIGSSIGVSVVFSILVNNIQTNHAELTEQITPYNPVLHLPQITRHWPMDTPAGLAAINAEITRQATMIAYLNDFRLMMFVTLLALPLVMLLRRPARRTAG